MFQVSLIPSPFGEKALGMDIALITVTVALLSSIQPDVVTTVTVYLVVANGLAIGFKILKLFNPSIGLHVISAISPVIVAFKTVLNPFFMVLSPPAFTVGKAPTFMVILLLLTTGFALQQGAVQAGDGDAIFPAPAKFPVRRRRVALVGFRELLDVGDKPGMPGAEVEGRVQLGGVQAFAGDARLGTIHQHAHVEAALFEVVVFAPRRDVIAPEAGGHTGQ